MANFSKIETAELAQKLNNSELGEATSDLRIKNDLRSLGARFGVPGAAGFVNGFSYVSFLFDSVVRKSKMVRRDYEQIKEDSRRLAAEKALSGRDIGAIPPVLNPERKKNCERDFRRFCEAYFPETFSKPWSEDHKKVIAKIEAAVLRGGLFALAMPRGSGKSSLTEAAVVWAMLYGHRVFVQLICATETAAVEMLSNIKIELETNDKLLEDFPEAVFPIRKLGGIANRCAGQLCNGERTRITWTNDEIVLPSVAGSRAAGVIVRVAGITGNIRGARFKRADGSVERPSLVVVDDPQTRESACSIEQTRKRLKVLTGDILGLAGPGKKISGIMPCTVIQIGDMADQILDREKHPEWNGERLKMLYSEPENLKLWERYAQIWGESLRADGTITAATEFYRANREAMDAGAAVAWEARFVEGELSAIQHAMNLKLQDAAAFAAEYQNEPLQDTSDRDLEISADQICARVNGIAAGTVPLYCTHLTMFIDVQKNLLYYLVAGWADDFTGAVVEYGAFPKQKRLYFTENTANPTLEKTFPEAGLEARLYAGLQALTLEMLGREFRREDGAAMKIERAMIDANWGQSTDTVYQVCRESVFSAILLPAHGRYVGASSKPMREYPRRPGERHGLNWLLPAVGARGIRHVIFDSNYWKSFIMARLLTAPGDPGALMLYGREPARHELLSRHLTAEYRIRTSGRNREVDEWKLRPENFDNHWLDCLSGSAVAASIAGCDLPSASAADARRSATALRLSALKKGGIGVAATAGTGGSAIKLSSLKSHKN